MKILKILFLAFIFIACKAKHGQLISTSSVKETLPNIQPIQHNGNAFVADSLDYLKNKFLDRKEFYINKELNVLLKDLDLKIEDYVIGFSGKNINISPDLGLYFFPKDFLNQRIAEKKNLLILNIFWQTPLSLDEILTMSRKNKQKWTEEERNYFGQFKIKDIGMVVPNY